jgi:flagellar biosynthesis GTPase FlhF
MREVDEALELMKDEFKNRMEACEERRMQFELKQAKMREQVLKFEKFIQENDAKRQRAEKKTKEERKTYEAKCQELNMLNKKIEEMESAQKNLEKQLRKLHLASLFLSLSDLCSSQRGRHVIGCIWSNFLMLVM